MADAGSRLAQPCRAEAYTTGKSSCDSSAPRRSKRSNVWFTTHWARAPSRSTLFTTTMGFRPSASALRVTKRVCGIGPSTASTSSSTPSTIDRVRSTSPPKSAWPGVSTILTCTPSKSTAVFLARIVMPRSFSMSFESITRSVMRSCAWKVPACCSSLSTSVVLPWSTWAMMAMLRSGRCAVRSMGQSPTKGAALYQRRPLNGQDFLVSAQFGERTPVTFRRAPVEVEGRLRNEAAIFGKNGPFQPAFLAFGIQLLRHRG